MTIGVIGTGLIGGSIGMSLKKQGHTILGWDLSEENLEIAKRRYAIDEATAFEQVCKSDVVFVCVPPGALIQTSEAIYKHKGSETVVTDCGSVKFALSEWAKDYADYVPGHPMAGHEKGGPSFASDWLFRGAKWILTPHENTSTSAVAKIEVLIKEMQAIPVHLPPDLHDRHVGVLSHLPHILAALLVQQSSTLNVPGVSGGSWKDLTRVGGVDPGLWTQILMENRSELSGVLSEFEFRFREVQEMIAAGDRNAIHAWLTKVVEAKNGS
jgi:prephenate dehydrogenase